MKFQVDCAPHTWNLSLFTEFFSQLYILPHHWKRLHYYDYATKMSLNRELQCSLSVLWLFHVGHVTNKCPVTWLEWTVFIWKKRMEDFWLWAYVVVRSSSLKISHRRLADDVIKFHQRECCICSTIIIFTYSTNHVSDLWHCDCPCRCHCCFFNSLIYYMRQGQI